MTARPFGGHRRLRKGRRTAVATLLSVAALLVTTPVQAAFPERPIRLIIGFPAGGPLDAHARLLADRMQQLLGQPIVIDYKPGAGGSIGAEFVAKAAPDGHTLLVANTGTVVINPALYPRLPYAVLRDLIPVARTAQQPLALVVNPAVPARTIGEFIALARARMTQQGADPAFLAPEPFVEFLRTELVRWDKAVKASGARLD